MLGLIKLQEEAERKKEIERMQAESRSRYAELQANNPNMPTFDATTVNSVAWRGEDDEPHTYRRDINDTIDPRVIGTGTEITGLMQILQLPKDDREIIAARQNTFQFLRPNDIQTQRSRNVAIDTYNYWYDKFKNLPSDVLKNYRKLFDANLSNLYHMPLDEFIRRKPYDEGDPKFKSDYNFIGKDISNVFDFLNNKYNVPVDPYFAESTMGSTYNRNRIHSMLQALRDTTTPEKHVTFNLPPVEPNTAINYPRTYQNIRAAHDANTSSSFFNDTDTGIRIRRNRARGLPDGMPSSVSHYYSDYSMYNSDYTTSAYRHRVKKRADEVSTRSFMSSTDDLLKLKPWKPSDSSYLPSRDTSYASSFLKDLSAEKPKWARGMDTEASISTSPSYSSIASKEDYVSVMSLSDIEKNPSSESSEEKILPKRKVKLKRSGAVSYQKRERPARKNKLHYSNSESFESSEEPQQLPTPPKRNLNIETFLNYDSDTSKLPKRDLSIESFISYNSNASLPKWAESQTEEYIMSRRKNVVENESEVSFEAPSKRKHLKGRSVLSGFYNRRVSPTLVVNANQFRRNTDKKLQFVPRTGITGGGDVGYTGEELDADLLLRRRHR